MTTFTKYIVIVTSIFLAACAYNPDRYDESLWQLDTGNLPEPDLALNITGLGPCTDHPDRTLKLNSNEPVNILVHGCFASSGRFRALAEVFAFHGQQTACYTYDDRDSLYKCGNELTTALNQLSSHMNNKNMTVIAHSQGGLITRKAFTEERPVKLNPDTSVNLVTISAPFDGIYAANHCGSTFARVISLGLVVPVCYAISGDKWHEITKVSEFITQPGALKPNVKHFVKIVTDENNTCRTYDENKRCIEDDYVFSVEEQYQRDIDKDTLTTNIEIKAGHVEIVGDRRVAPEKLINILQTQRLMKSTPDNKQAQLDRLLKYLYDL